MVQLVNRIFFFLANIMFNAPAVVKRWDGVGKNFRSSFLFV